MTTLFDRIMEDFKNKAIVRGGMFMFSFADALELVRACHNFRLRILGIDGFFLRGLVVQPTMEFSVDYTLSGIDDPSSGNWEKAEEFLLKHADKGLFFEVVAESEPMITN